MCRNAPVDVSIIILAYNQSKLLRSAVESVLAQTYPSIETIVIDDGSTDDTPEAMRQYDGRIRYIRCQHVGAAAALRTGIEAAKGRYLGRLDHDDLFAPTKIERQVEVLDCNHDIGLVHCRYYHIDEAGSIIDKVGLLPDGDVLNQLVHGDFVWSGGPLYRRECLSAGIPADDVWTGDFDQLLRIALAGYRFGCVQQPLGAYRMVHGSMMDDLTRVEQSTFAVLDRTFSDPRLPRRVAMDRRRVYGEWRCWMSCMYYAAGQWEDADRNLRQALALCPAYLTQPAELVRFLADYALSARIKDPIGFVGGLTEHLPSGVGLGGLNAQLLAQVYAGLALRRYGAGQAREANRLLAEAIALYPEMLRDPSLFPRLLVHSSLTLPVGDSGAYIEHVFGSLPTSARALSRFRSRVIGEVAAASAFEDYHAARHTAVIRKVAMTARYRPARLVNRGVVSIFVRSLGRLAWSKLAHRGGNTAGRRDRWWSVE